MVPFLGKKRLANKCPQQQITTGPLNVEVHKRREINLIERRKQAIQSTINGMESKMSEMESKMRERRGGGVVVTPSGVYPVVGQ